jgi:hypothetical protein
LVEVGERTDDPATGRFPTHEMTNSSTRGKHDWKFGMWCVYERVYECVC